MDDTKNRIVIGELDKPIIVLDDRCLVSCDLNISYDTISTELPIDTVEFVVNLRKYADALLPLDDNDGIVTSGNDIIYALEDIDSNFSNLAENTKVFIYSETCAFGPFYVCGVRRVKTYQYEVKGQSIIGVMDNAPFYGALFIENEDQNQYNSAIEILKWIFTGNDCGVKNPRTSGYTSQDVLYGGLYEGDVPVITDFFKHYFAYMTDNATEKLFGLISPGTRRTAFHQLLNACGLCFRPYPNAPFHYMLRPIYGEFSISDSFEYDDPNIETTEIVDAVEVTVHKYINGISPDGPIVYETLVENVDFGNTLTVVPLGSPCFDVKASDGLILYRYCANVALVKGCGKLHVWHATDRSYTLSKKIGNLCRNKKTITDNGLISSYNANRILNTACDYYTDLAFHNINTLLPSVNVNVGSKYTFSNCYREPDSGVLSAAIIRLSNKSKVQCRIVSNALTSFKYKHYELLTGIGNWTTPQSILAADKPELFVIIIAGGTGGSSGLKGKDGALKTFDNSFSTTSNPSGGMGECGLGGKITAKLLSGSEIKENYAFSCGAGGTGGKVCNSQDKSNIGADGTATVFGNWSSDAGSSVEAGFTNPITGITYGAKQKNGIALSYYGCSGYKTQLPDNTISAAPGFANFAWWDDTKRFSGGKVEKILETIYHEDGTQQARCSVTYGDPGGAGVGEEGHSPSDPQKKIDGTIITGGGGNGGNSTLMPPNPLQLNPKQYGWGGFGGCGGGAGGSAGLVTFKRWPWGVESGKPGVGGCGGPGGQGAPGCVLVFW